MNTFIFDKKTIPPKFYLFSYGANNIDQLSTTLNYIPTKNIKHILKIESIGISIYGYERVLFGYSKRWNGAIASIIKSSSNKYVRGIITFIQNINNNFMVGNILINFYNLLKREEFLKTYILEVIGTYNGYPILAFIKNPSYVPRNNKVISNDYLMAILKTIHDSLYNVKNKISVPITLNIDINYLSNILSPTKIIISCEK